MSELAALAGALIAGVLLGAMFFGGLWWTVWWTVCRGLASGRLALWFGISLLLRASAVLAGFHFVAGDDWKRLLLCLLGYVIARVAAMRFARLPRQARAAHAPEGAHAP